MTFQNNEGCKNTILVYQEWTKISVDKIDRFKQFDSVYDKSLFCGICYSLGFYVNLCSIVKDILNFRVLRNTGCRTGLLWSFTRSLILYGQQYVLFNKNQFSLISQFAFYRFKFCHTKLSLNGQNILLSWQILFCIIQLRIQICIYN